MNWLIKRVGQAIFTIWVVVTLSFLLIRFMPGGPLDYLRVQLRNQGLPPSTVNQYVQNYINITPDAPLWKQYLDYMFAIVQGDFGVSYWTNEPVFETLAAAMPWTVFLMSIATFVTFGIGIALGSLMAYLEGSKFDSSMTVVSIVLTSIPYYVLAVMLVYVLGYQLSYFPTGGRVDASLSAGFNWPYVRSILYYAALPLLSMIIPGWGGTALSMRGNSISILGEDYLRVARLRGLSRRRIALRYVARNAMLPLYTGILISIGFMLGGSVILETIFNYTGIGYYLFEAVSSRDYPMMMGAFILITIAVVIGVLVADLTYHKIDPRAAREGEREAF